MDNSVHNFFREGVQESTEGVLNRAMAAGNAAVSRAKEAGNAAREAGNAAVSRAREALKDTVQTIRGVTLSNSEVPNPAS